MSYSGDSIACFNLNFLKNQAPLSEAVLYCSLTGLSAAALYKLETGSTLHHCANFITVSKSLGGQYGSLMF